jgi:hypothetical protein
MQSSALDDRMLDWWLNDRKRVAKAHRKDFDSICTDGVEHVPSRTFSRGSILAIGLVELI